MSNTILRYGFADTLVGAVLVASGRTGVAAILLGDDGDRLLRDLAAVYPDAALVEGQGAVAEPLRRVECFLADPHQPLDLELELRGTEAERAVWSALRAIPAGETRSYGRIAKTLPTSVTAQEVGAACAANVHALAIPCHRVVKADGGISGYRWGVARKRRLLKLEAAA